MFIKTLDEIEGVADALFGSKGARRLQKVHRRLAADPAAGVRQFLEKAGPAEAQGNPPIFILSAGWRSGSTLLQRLVSSSEGLLIWGEAYDRSAIVQRMVESLAPFDGKWPTKKFTEQPDPASVSDQWIANIYPPVDALRDAYLATLTTLFAEPAKQLGATHWGFKEVRFGLAEARLLKGLFPHGRFLFIQRDLETAYESYSRFSKYKNWHARWPDRPVFTPFSFGRHWGRLTSEFETAVPETGGMLVRYEDLITRKAELGALEQYLGLSVDVSVLDSVVGSGATRKNANKRITQLDRFILSRGARAGARLAKLAISDAL